MIPKKPAPHLMRDGYRFPACAKPFAGLVVWFDASAGEARSEKIMLPGWVFRNLLPAAALSGRRG
jgi:hypothetical protein